MAGESDRADVVVCVTGGSGYVGSWVVSELLAAGYSVNTTVRDKTNESKVAHLKALPNADARLSLFDADLLGPDGCFDEAIKGCTYVMHTASPVVVNFTDPQKQLVDPALNGTLSVLRSCKKVGGSTLKRVVVTSSLAAISDHGSNGKTFNEENWNTTSTLTRLPYFYGKTLAERAAWDFVKNESPGFELCVVNPSLCLGPTVSAKNLGDSVTECVIGFVEGKCPAILDMNLHLVDVRDVAVAHVKAMTGPPGQRYLCHSEDVKIKDYVAFLKELGYTPANGFKTPRLDLSGTVGTYLMWLVSFTMGMFGAMIRLELGNPLLLDNSKIQRDLGIEFRPWKETVRETIDDLTEKKFMRPLPSKENTADEK